MEFDSKTVMVAGILYAILFCALWFLDFVGAWVMWQKIVLTIVFIPICYFIAAWQVNQG